LGKSFLKLLLDAQNGHQHTLFISHHHNEKI